MNSSFAWTANDVLGRHHSKRARALLPNLPKTRSRSSGATKQIIRSTKKHSSFSDSGIPFYVCPGTSSWCSIAGRTDNMLANRRAARGRGRDCTAPPDISTPTGAITDICSLAHSYAGLAAGAAMSWCFQSDHNLPLPRLLDLHVFKDSAEVMAPPPETGKRLPGGGEANRQSIGACSVFLCLHRRHLIQWMELPRRDWRRRLR